MLCQRRVERTSSVVVFGMLALLAACGDHAENSTPTTATPIEADPRPMVQPDLSSSAPSDVTLQENEGNGLQIDTSGNDPVAVLTPLGIPVVVIQRTDAGYSVLTPCGNTAQISKGEPIDGIRVVVDPGHGGHWDTGAVGPNGLLEKDLNLKLSRAVLEELADRGIPAATTRTFDYGVRLSARAAFADVLGADVLISIHHNAPTWNIVDIPGSEVYVQSATPQQARVDSARLGGLLYEEIIAGLSSFDDVSWSRLPDAGVLRVLQPDGNDTYGILRHPSTPSALIEYGYLSNPDEAKLFATPEYIRVAARATADAIDTYLHTDRTYSGFIHEPRSYDPPSSSIPCDDPTME